MKMYNYEIKPFCEFLLSLELPAKATRMRSRFVKTCQDRLLELENERRGLLDKYSNKNPDGTPAMKQDGRTVDMAKQNEDAFVRDYEEMMNEKFVIDELNERIDMLISVRDAVLNIDENMKFSGQKAIEYDRWCEIVEGIRDI